MNQALATEYHYWWTSDAAVEAFPVYESLCHDHEVDEPCDYAVRAAALPAVVRLNRAARVFPWIGLAVLFTAIIVSAMSHPAWALVGVIASPLFMAASGFCRKAADSREHDAIALWVHRDDGLTRSDNRQ